MLRIFHLLTVLILISCAPAPPPDTPQVNAEKTALQAAFRAADGVYVARRAVAGVSHPQDVPITIVETWRGPAIRQYRRAGPKAFNPPVDGAFLLVVRAPENSASPMIGIPGASRSLARFDAHRFPTIPASQAAALEARLPGRATLRRWFEQSR